MIRVTRVYNDAKKHCDCCGTTNASNKYFCISIPNSKHHILHSNGSLSITLCEDCCVMLMDSLLETYPEREM